MSKNNRTLALAMLLSVLLGANSLSRAATVAPLKLTSDFEGNTVIISVVTTETVTLSNYDIQLAWDSATFTLTDITNGQTALFGNFQRNVSTGKISAASGGDNVIVPAGVTLAIYTFSVTGNAAGDFPFTLTVRDVADENGDTLVWKGIAVQTSLTISAPSHARITGVSSDGAVVTITASCSTDGAVLCCAVYKTSGQYVTMKTAPLDNSSTEKTYTLNLGTTDFACVKVFALSSGFRPLCASVQKP